MRALPLAQRRNAVHIALRALRKEGLQVRHRVRQTQGAHGRTDGGGDAVRGGCEGGRGSPPTPGAPARPRTLPCPCRPAAALGQTGEVRDPVRVLSGWRSTRDRHQRGERSGRCWRAVLPCAHWWRGARCRPMPASRWPRALTPSFPAASSNSTTGSLSLHGASARRSSALPQEARPSHGNKAGGERQRAADARVRSAELVHSRARA